MKQSVPGKRQEGFTLMELIIAMVILGILTAIAIPNYTAYVQRSNRSEARNALLEAATWMERFRTERGRYDDPPGTQALPLGFQCVPRNLTGYGTCRLYEVRVDAAQVGATTYRLVATRVATGPMATDVCNDLRIDQSGLRDWNPLGSGTAGVCWNQ